MIYCSPVNSLISEGTHFLRCFVPWQSHSSKTIMFGLYLKVLKPPTSLVIFGFQNNLVTRYHFFMGYFYIDKGWLLIFMDMIFFSF